MMMSMDMVKLWIIAIMAGRSAGKGACQLHSYSHYFFSSDVPSAEVLSKRIMEFDRRYFCEQRHYWK